MVVARSTLAETASASLGVRFDRPPGVRVTCNGPVSPAELNYGLMRVLARGSPEPRWCLPGEDPGSRTSRPLLALILTCDLPGVPSEQAYVPAEQPPPGEDARLPAAHAHPGRPGDPGGTAPEGARARQRLTARDSGSAMLPAAARMRRRADFKLAVDDGSRAGRSLVSGHLLVRPDSEQPPLIGFVVGRGVGTAVVRNKVRRRLRHMCRGYLERLPGGSLLVLRASPRAAAARQADLAADLDLVIGKLLRRQGWVAGR